MKKILISLLCLVVLLFSVSANSQEYYPVSSSVWQTVNALCHTAGVVGPSSYGPVTADQLLVALNRAEKVLGEDNAVLKGVKERLTSDEYIYTDKFGSINLSGYISPEVYFQTNKPFGENDEEKPVYDLDDDWFIKSSREVTPLIAVTLENSIHDILYSRFVLAVEQALDYNGEDYKEVYWNKYFHTQFMESTIFRNFPKDAGISIGAKGLNLIVGRSRVSLGEGYTGNTAIGDNYDYQEFLKSGFYTEHTSVFLTLTTFDSSHFNPYVTDRKGILPQNNPWTLLSSRFTGYRELRHAVNYELTPTNNFKISLGFVCMMDTTCAFDIRYLNPFMIFHDYFNYHEETILEANNMITADFSWAVAKKWNLYGQLTMDQYQMKGEAEGYMGFGYTEPNAFGGLLNLSYSDIIDNGLLNVYLEGVYNMPGMYLNSKYYITGTDTVTQYNKSYDGTEAYKRCYSQDFLTGYKRTESNYDDIAYSTYIYGGDCLVFSLGGSYRKPDTYSVKASALYMAHGEKGRGSEEKNYTFEGIDQLENVKTLGLFGTVEHTLVVKAEGEVKVWEYLSLSLGAAYSYRWNWKNTEGKTFGNLQAYVGFRLSTSSIEI